MGIIYQVLLRCLKVRDLDQVILSPYDDKSSLSEKEYLDKAIANCHEKFNEIYIDGQHKRDLCVGNYPIHPNANVVSFTNTACDEYDGAGFRIVFVTDSGICHTDYILSLIHI